MKKIIIFLIACVAFSSCNQLKENEYRLNVEIKGVEDGKKVYVKKSDEQNLPVTLDSTVVKDGKFSISGFSETPELHYVFIEGVQGNLGYIAEPGNINAIAYKDSITKSVLSGSPTNDDFNDFLNESKMIGNKIGAVRKDYAAASKAGDTVTLATLNETYQELMVEAGKFETEFIKNHPGSFMSALILERMLFTRGKNSEEVKNLFAPLSDEIKNTRVGKNISNKLAELAKTGVGSEAPNFEGPTPDGKVLSLSAVRGKVTIIDFWASWCKPCRAENPKVVELYNKYHDKGLNIIGVSLDKTAEAWTTAIEEDGLLWYHVSNLKYWQDPIARLYNIRSIPATFVLDSEGKIIAKGIKVMEFESQIAEILAGGS
jgi:thiol-disulfide isomerase/thioredoxin